MNEILDNQPEEVKGRLIATGQPEWIEPMMAKLSHQPFSRPGWVFERKLDGERILAFKQDGQARLMTRNRKQAVVQYPELVEALEGVSADDFIVDGEVVAFEDGRSSFERLQQRMHLQSEQEARQSGVRVFYYLFDVLYWDGYNLTNLPLRRRKALLKKMLAFDDPLRFLPHRNQHGVAYYEQACARGWEGLIAKDAGSPYKGTRSSKWLKFKCVNRQEFVVGGFTDPEGERIGFGALLVGYYAGGGLQYAGKVGTGYDRQTLRDLRERIGGLEQEQPPFEGSDELPSGSGVHWIKPELVAQVGFTEWTQTGKLRHPRYLGLRRDKAPEQVTREEAV